MTTLSSPQHPPSSPASKDHPKSNAESIRIRDQIYRFMDDYGKYSAKECECKPWKSEELCERCTAIRPFEHLIENIPQASFETLETIFGALCQVVPPVLSKHCNDMACFGALFSTLVTLPDDLVWVPSAQEFPHIEPYQHLLCCLMDSLGSGIIQPIVTRAVAQLALVKNSPTNTVPPQNTHTTGAMRQGVSFIQSKSELNARYSNALRLLRAVVTKMPQWKNVVGSCLITNFSIETMSINHCVAYLKNLFRITTFSADFQQSILNLVVERLMTLDSKLKLNSDALTLLNDPRCFSTNSTPGSPVIGSPLSVSPSPSSHYLSKMHIDDFILNSESEQDISEQEKLIYLAEKLDRCMKIVFDYLQRCAQLENRQQIMKHIFSNFVDIFNRSILKTYELNSTQFIMFYICSFDKRFGQHFIEFLFNKMFDNNMYPEARRVSIAYAGSFLARAKFLDQSVILQSMERMVKWMKNYVDTHSHSITEINVEHHAVFYHIAQCFFYVLCYHVDRLQAEHNAEVSSRVGANHHNSSGSLLSESLREAATVGVHPFLEQIRAQIEEIVRSSLNPLRVIPKDVTQQVVRALLFYGIVDCTEVARKNLVLPVRNKRRSKFLEHAYFPFDPYVLRESREYIEPIYRQWDARVYHFSDDVESQLSLLLSNHSDPSVHINIVAEHSSAAVCTPTRQSASRARSFGVRDRRQELAVGSFDDSCNMDEDDSSSVESDDEDMLVDSDDEDFDDMSSADEGFEHSRSHSIMLSPHF
eukprot:CAMPEP_0117438138 /NCGR_PEP_ID=MMETSP0759-20121206/1896_1 /TAXON_ID=63605 /ORGANISM="Percolomonas cosmopolitus, Strain WS" /LENGTH=758 /DNA_ID=CAMNT_0005229815 /DNA_START=1 /DNA_END=2277 /DNA_ORIENTATION=+